MQWISTKKYPIPPQGKYLVLNKDRDQAVVLFCDGYFKHGSWHGSCQYGCGGDVYFEDITHWMPLPEAPKD